MPVELPASVDALDALLRRRIRDQEAIDGFRVAAAVTNAAGRKLPRSGGAAAVPPSRVGERPRHVVGQTGCFCTDCLLHRKQEWRIGDVNPAVVGPRDRWMQFTWGSADRGALGAIDGATVRQRPLLTPTVREKLVVLDSKQRRHCIERDAKFTAVSSGKFHTVMLSESAGAFTCGDDTYGALGVDGTASEVATPTRVADSSGQEIARVQLVAASGYASFALAVLPVTDAKPRRQQEESKPDRRPPMLRRKSIEDVAMGHRKVDEVIYNHLYSWGRGDRGVLGHGDTESSAIPRIIGLFNTMRVLELSAGLQHVLVLTEFDGVFAFGDGSNGKLGTGDVQDRMSPVKIQALDGLNVIHISAGDEHSIAVTGETFFNRQVFSWGLGSNGRLGHNDDQLRTKPTRVNHFRGRKVITVVAGGAHNLATSEMPDGICVWSWGCGAYGQLGHRETWDIWLPRSIDELRREGVRFVDAGERHSLAIGDNGQLWLWGKGIHGQYEVQNPDPHSTSIVQPIKVQLPGLQLVSAKAGRGRTFVWGDRSVCCADVFNEVPACGSEQFRVASAITKKQVIRSFGGSAVASVCSALPEYESLTSDAFRILFRCGACGLEDVCVACAHKCHIQHCLELGWTLENTLSRECDCFSSGNCMFDLERGADTRLNDVGDES